MRGNIRDILLELVRTGEEIYSEVCTVNKVDEAKRTIDVSPINGKADILNVRLQSKVSGDKGVLIVPKVGTEVIVTFTSKITAFMTLCNDVDKILIEANETIIFNKGEKGGLINVEDLIEKINTIEKDINDLKTVFSQWVTVPNDGGAALKSIAASWFGSQLTETERGDIEDESIKH